MESRTKSDRGRRFPHEIICDGVWLHHRFFRKLLKGLENKLWQPVGDKLRSYGAAHRTIMPSVDHNTDRYANS